MDAYAGCYVNDLGLAGSGDLVTFANDIVRDVSTNRERETEIPGQKRLAIDKTALNRFNSRPIMFRYKPEVPIEYIIRKGVVLK